MIARSIPINAFIVALLVTSHASVAQDADGPVYVQDKTLIVAKVTDSNEFLAYSKQTGKWTSYTFPDGVTAVPVVTGDMCAFDITGDKITEIVAVDHQGNWRSYKLPMTTAMKCEPIVSGTVAVYSIDGHAHAFSAVLGEWDSLAATATPSVSKDIAMIVTRDRIAVFSAVTANWAVADLKKKDKKH